MKQETLEKAVKSAVADCYEQERRANTLAKMQHDLHHVCNKYGCWREPLKYMTVGQSHQTNNGFFTIMINGFYCPNCGAGYGGVK